MPHTFLTVAIPFAEARVADVRTQLDQMGNPANDSIRDLLRNQGIHFLSAVIVPGDSTHGPFLAVEASSDHADAAHAVAVALGSELASVIRAAGLTGTSSELPSSATVEQLLKRHSHVIGQSLFATPGLCFTGTPGMDVRRITLEYNLGRLIRNMLQQGDIAGTSLQILNQIRTRVEGLELDRLRQLLGLRAPRGDQEIQEQEQLLKDLKALLVQHDSPLLAPAEGSSFPLSTIISGVVLFTWPYLIIAFFLAVGAGVWAWYTTGLFWGAVAFGFMGSVGILGLIGIVAIAYGRLRSLEASDIPDNSPPDAATLSDVIRRENPTNEKEQNHLYGVSVMKDGLLRNLILRVVFWVIVQAATKTSRPGFLGQLGTIHFARWMLLPGTNKLLFFSNFGGSWESYLEDFITKAHGGLTGVWSNTVGFPRTANVFQDGATDGDRFKRWARRQQQPTRFWYSAYPHLTTDRIRLNTAIRQGLVSAATEDQASEWLSCFGSRPRAGNVIESSLIQSILFGGFHYLPHAACLLIRLPADTNQARQWLTRLEPHINFGDTPPAKLAVQVAFTQTGLRCLGCTDHVLNEFPVAFREGMSAAHRTNLLFDTGDDHPRHWQWGNGDQAIDAAILVYALTDQILTDFVADCTGALNRYGGELKRTINLAVHDPLAPTREPFGFVDGISQPIIRGIRRWVAEGDQIHMVEPGEFILGYLDNRGFLPLSPTLPATADPHNILPAVRSPVLRELPDYCTTAANDPRDFGCNGSFLVIRQLEQDVPAFTKTLSEMAKKLHGNPGVPDGLTVRQIEEWLAAKIIGRWRDGTSVVRYPHAPGGGWKSVNASPDPDGPAKTGRPPDNSFLLGEEDPLGMRCPFGSHIRRANPRESLHPGSKDQLDITNRHRILRMGRAYAPEQTPQGLAKPGLLFMCLNADIERQFEFIQQTWVGERLFHGLDGEVDPVLGRGGKGGRLTIPTADGPIQLSGFQDFVKVLGGSYFFLPGRRAVRYLASLPSIAETWKYTPVT